MGVILLWLDLEGLLRVCFLGLDSQLGIDKRVPLTIIQTLKTEKRTLQNIFIIIVLIGVRKFFGFSL